ncbi:MAG: type II toxin-antitoxin system prevent-host-death family antitoxin [Gemmatimonadetes bacterium]|nr:type II toxin-antitoxin system prevent-host-death family antitoxin [Gemmatimonadota bacterium]
MITTTSISELKARLSAFLDIVRQGNEVLVTDRGRLIARLAPVTGDQHEESRRDLLLKTGRLRAPTASLPKDFWTRRRPEDPDGQSLKALLDERESGW